MITRKQMKEQIEFLEKELQKKESELKEIKNNYEDTRGELIRQKHINAGLELYKEAYYNNLNLLTIKKIIRNKIATIVYFDNGDKVVVRKAENDNDSIYTAVAYAIIKNVFGSNSGFKKHVNRRLKNEK